MNYLPWLLSVHHSPGKRCRPIHHLNCKACGASLPILQISTCKHLSVYYLRAEEQTSIENVFLSSSKDRVRKRVEKCEQNLSGPLCECFSSNLRILQLAPLDRSAAHLSQLTSLDHLPQLPWTAESFLYFTKQGVNKSTLCIPGMSGWVMVWTRNQQEASQRMLKLPLLTFHLQSDCLCLSHTLSLRRTKSRDNLNQWFLNHPNTAAPQ